jgi:hypothetical protein
LTVHAFDHITRYVTFWRNEDAFERGSEVETIESDEEMEEVVAC